LALGPCVIHRGSGLERGVLGKGACRGFSDSAVLEALNNRSEYIHLNFLNFVSFGPTKINNVNPTSVILMAVSRGFPGSIIRKKIY